MERSSIFRINNTYYPYLLAVILVFALIIRLIGLNKGIWIDEYFSFRWNEGDSIWKLIVNLRGHDKPPLSFVLLYFWTKISNSEEFCRLLSLFFDIGTIIVVMSWLKQYSPVASVLGGLYFATTPIMLRYSQEIRLYSLLVFATTLTFFFASRITLEPKKLSGYIGIALSLTLAMSTHLVAIMLIVPIFIFIVLMTVLSNRKINWINSIIAMAIPSSAFCFFYFFYLNNLDIRTANWWMPSVSWKLISSTAQYLFGLSSLYFSSQIDHLIAFIFLAIITIAVIFGKWKHNFPFLVAAIIFWLEIIVYSLIKNPIFFYRIVLLGLVPFVGFLVLQIATIEIKNIKKIVIVLFTILSIVFTFNWVTIQAYRPVEYYKQAAQLVESQSQSNSLVLFFPGYIADTVKYHQKKTTQYSEIVAWDANDIKKIKLEINKKLADIDKEKINTIFLVTRVDLTVKNEDYKNVLSAIKSEIEKPLKVKSFLIISHDFCFINSDKPNSFLETLKTEFGKPFSYQDKKAYVLSEYELSR
jgi:hypothetical protein